jgi:phosphate transport system protein
MRDAFEDQLAQLLQKIMRMGGLAEAMLDAAVKSLLVDDPALAAAVYDRERQVNALQSEVDEDAVRITVQFQPVARDVRFVFVAGRAATDVERIADLAVNVYQNARHATAAAAPAGGGAPSVRMPIELGAMADRVLRMLGDALTALVARDVALADRVLAAEDEVDRYRDRVFHAMLDGMIGDRAAAQRAMSYVLVARNLERVGDHATNVAEEVIYMVRGRDVRHPHAKPERAVAALERTKADG